MLIDIHSHILPVLDDGATNIEQSLSMLKIASNNHIMKIVATPHYKAFQTTHSLDTIDARIRQLQNLALEKGIEGVTIYRGTEIYYQSNMVELLTNQVVSTMAGTSYVLVEFSPKDEYSYIRAGLSELLSAGYRPIIAHVERYDGIMQKVQRVEELIRMGCFIQVNVAGIMGELGFRQKIDTGKLLRNHWVHFIASDAHRSGNKIELLQECFNKLSKKYEKEYVEALFCKNAEKILQNESI